MTETRSRGQWGSKFGFILAAAGSAVGLGNIWKFPSEVASNGGGAFLIIYLFLCFIVGYPVMVAELSIGRHTNRNPFGAFRSLTRNPIFGAVGLWGILCGVMILSFYAVVAGWTLSFVFSEFLIFLGNDETASWFSNLGDPVKNSIFSILFMLATIKVVSGGVSDGIEKVAKILMPLLIGILLIMIGYVMTLDGAMEGLSHYLTPSISGMTPEVIFQSMGQAFFSLSLGMGALITYGSYLDKKENIPEVAAYVTLADVGIAFIAGLLIIPSMYVAQAGGIEIFGPTGELLNEDGLVFNVLPELFKTMGTTGNLVFGVSFFTLLSMAALTSTISLLEVPTSFLIDETSMGRKKASWTIGLVITAIAVLVSVKSGLIGTFSAIFNNYGLPIGGFMICVFIGYVWKTSSAMKEMESGFDSINDHWFGKFWSFTVKFICPILILFILIRTVINQFS